MNVPTMHYEFDLTLDKIASSAYAELEPWEKDYYLTEAQTRFVKTRYNENNSYRKGFEQSQKRTDDLKNIVVSRFCKVYKVNDSINPESGAISTQNTYRIGLDQFYRNEVEWDTTLTPRVAAPRGTPIFADNQGNYPAESPKGDRATTEKYMFFIQCSANAGTSCSDRWGFVRMIQQNNFEIAIRDPFNKPTPSNPIMYFEEGDIYVCAGEAKINDFLLTFIKKPSDICIGTYGNKPVQECELSEHTHKEIIQMAVTIALENLSSQRVQSQAVINEKRIE